ncbi:MAG: ribonuclease PH [Nitrospinae bacterium]|nr:ribonuclease PH [Nitrospinota bacterium]
MRTNGRAKDQLRKVIIHPNYIKHAAGSVLIEIGDTRVICAANVENKVPPFLANSGKGWVTAEYSMLPSATNPRGVREATRGRIGGRTHEIQRLIGRSLRSVVDMEKLGEKTISVDCDVIQADGGTRTASITGAFLALAFSINSLKKSGAVDGKARLIKDHLAATSVGLINGEAWLDLDYSEDSKAEVDLNVVMTGSGKFVEIQGTAEKEPFSLEDMRDFLDIAAKGIRDLIEIQKEFLRNDI